MLGKKTLIALAFPFFLTGCETFNTQKAFEAGAGVLQAATLDEASVKQTASLAAKEMDAKSNVAAPGSSYAQRLERMTRNVKQYDGLSLNYKVYQSKDINAFAMADGTVRVYSGLMDVMPDDQVFAVICHEIAHVKKRHSYNQLRERLLTDAAFKAAVSVGGTVGALTAGQLGQLGVAAASAHFSQSDELEADAYAVEMLKRLGKDPYAMKRSIQTLESKSHSGGGGFLSTHPSNHKRIENIEKAIKG